MADVIDRDIVVLAPKKRHGIEGLPTPQYVERRDLALPFRDHPVLDADALAGMRIGPAGDVAGCEDAGRAGFEVLVDSHAAIDRKASLLGELDRGTHACADDDEIRLDARGVLERDAPALHFRHGRAQVKYHAMGFVYFAHEGTELSSEHTFKWNAFRPDDMHFDASLAQRGRRFKADEACAHDHDAFCSSGRCHNGLRVGESARAEERRGGGSREIHPYRIGPRRQQQSVEGELPPPLKLYVAPLQADRCHPRVEGPLAFALALVF